MGTHYSPENYKRWRTVGEICSGPATIGLFAGLVGAISRVSEVVGDHGNVMRDFLSEESLFDDMAVWALGIGLVFSIVGLASNAMKEREWHKAD